LAKSAARLRVVQPTTLPRNRLRLLNLLVVAIAGMALLAACNPYGSGASTLAPGNRPRTVSGATNGTVSMFAGGVLNLTGSPAGATSSSGNTSRTATATKSHKRTTTVPSCSGPITITSGGTYTGCWVSNDSNTYAVTIATSAPVTITGSTIKGSAYRLVGNVVNNVKLTATNNFFYGLYPGGTGIAGGYAIYLIGFDYADIEHNYVEQKGGFKLGNWSGASVTHPVTVKYNRAKNIDGRLTDGTGGYNGSIEKTQFLAFDNVSNAPGVEIAWNEVHNDPFNSGVEDNINTFNSSGTQASLIDIHDNFIDGAYPQDPANTASYTGGGILLGDYGGNYEAAHDNQVIRTTNYGIGIVGGPSGSSNPGSSNLALYNNRVITSGLLPDGTPIPSVNCGMAVWGDADVSFVNDSAHDNLIGWWKPSSPGRNDWWIPAAVGSPRSNTSLHGSTSNAEWQGEGGLVTRDDEANEVTLWNEKLASNGITVGPS
jgi:hypothetical protein